MKRLIPAILLVATLGVAPVVAQLPDISDYKSGLQSFSDEFATSLPMNSTIGLNWSDAYVGQLLPIPSLGIGITTGVTTVPGDVFTSLLDDLNIEPSSGALESIGSAGLPIPGYAIDARIGGLVLPFDVGLKFGTLPGLSVGDVDVEYQNIGADIRYAILDGGVLPKVSVGVGYNRLSGRISTPLGIGTQSFNNGVSGRGRAEAELTDPELALDWTANVFDVRLQASKSFLIVEPHIGLGATFGSAETTAGLESNATLRVDSGSGLQTVDASEFEQASGLDVSGNTVGVTSTANPFTVRAFGGASLNLTVIRIDLGLMYNLSSGSLGGTLGTRFQI